MRCEAFFRTAARQAETMVLKGDLLIAISTSGNSSHVIPRRGGREHVRSSHDRPDRVLVAAALASSIAFAGDTRTIALDIANMTCAACPITVRKSLERVAGVTSAKVDYATKRATVTFDSAKTTSSVAQAGR